MERLLDADLNASKHVVIISFIIVVTCIQIGIPDVLTLSHLGGGNKNLEYSQGRHPAVFGQSYQARIWFCKIYIYEIAKNQRLF